MNLGRYFLRNATNRSLGTTGPLTKGHSHYQNTKKEKEKKAAERSKIFERFSREIVRVVRDPDLNKQLADIIVRAGQIQYPREKIQESISIALRKNKEGPAQDVYITGCSNIGFNIMVYGKSSAREHFINQVRTLFKKNNIVFDDRGSSKYSFIKCGIIEVSNLFDRNDPDKGSFIETQNQVLELKDEFGAQYANIKEHPELGSIIEFIVEPNEMEAYVSAIKMLNIFGELNDQNLWCKTDFVATEVVEVPEGLKVAVEKIIDSFYEIPDVVQVYDNIKNIETPTYKMD
ncbi:putative transcriptional regulatory protein [Thelohanellus kitauei]|uniref:Putative transcriptional regulatory protein n=1 Tax=Thelohanellus kitauei TaxID=669202 RepID=A0A0C2IZK4_THEKT|nr:putative transcriptional regulatory protein [Thelohanellus kitauei]